MRSSHHSLISSGALLVALATLAAACGNSADANEALGQNSGPLADMFGWSDYDVAEGNRLQLEAEQLISDCMREEGFEYVPVDYSAQIPDDTGEPEWGSKDFGEKYGYGLMRSYEQWEAENIQNQIDGKEYVDDVPNPNDEYVASLTDSEQQAYNEALWGPPQEEPEDGIWVQPSWEEQGCYGLGQHEINGDDPWAEPGFGVYFESATARMEDDPTLLAANRDWIDCLDDPFADETLPDGMILDGPESVWTVLDALKNMATGQEILPLDPETGEPIGNFDDSMGYSSTQDADGTGWAFVGEQHLISAADIDHLQALEISLWAKDMKCQDEVGMKDIRNVLEQQLVDGIRAEFPGIGTK